MNGFEPAATPDPGVLDVRALSTLLDGPAPRRLAFVGAAGSDEALVVAREVAARTSRETDRQVLVVHVSPRAGDDWSLFTGQEEARERRFVRTITAPERASSSQLLSALGAWRSGDEARDRSAADHALLTVRALGRDAAGDRRVEAERLLAIASEAFDVVLFAGDVSTPDVWSRAGAAVIVVELERTAELLVIRDALKADGVTVAGEVIGRAPRVVLLRFLPSLRRRVAWAGLSGVAALVLTFALGASALWWLAPADRMVVSAQPVGESALVARSFSVPVDLPVLASGRPPALGRVASRLPVEPVSPAVRRRPTTPPPVTDVAQPVLADALAPGAVAPAAASTVTRVPPPPGRPVAASVDGLVRPRRVAALSTTPRFATMAGLERVSATVVLTAVVRTDGTVGGVQLVEVTGSPEEVVEPAIEAVRQWRYHPATRDGRPVEASITVQVRFEES